MLKLRFIVLAIAIAFALTSPLQARDDDAFQLALGEIADSDDVVGLAVAVVRDGNISFMDTYGVRELGQVAPIDTQTTFRIASLSKAFAATAVADLTQEGKLSLNDPIANYVDHFRLRDQSQANRATLSDVLSHRMSLPPYAYDNLLEAGITPPKILKEMKKVKPICRVGTCYAYQNVPYNMIASAIEVADDTSYQDSVKTRIFLPLGMDGASFGAENLMRTDNWARSYTRRKNAPWKKRPVKQPYYDVPAAGGVNANIEDMAKWLQANLGYMPTTLSEDIRHLMHMPRVRTPGEIRRLKKMHRTTDAHYGLGWRIYEYAGETVINHSGAVEGYNAQIAFLPERNTGIVLMTNSRAKPFWDILPMFLDNELGLENERLTSARNQAPPIENHTESLK